MDLALLPQIWMKINQVRQGSTEPVATGDIISVIHEVINIFGYQVNPSSAQTLVQAYVKYADDPMGFFGDEDAVMAVTTILEKRVSNDSLEPDSRMFAACPRCGLRFAVEEPKLLNGE